ncbi:serine/threonine-protein phosphatase 4 regulatory subunit 4-like isoform X1 [Temnothorax curvispinosus]|uniref:Serine/threonine-protein phosphatase 4 regulatory subunit 4-like isoform X1 n=1 Tax=Temnothorax curvispinosus TaxID=300111 RepID=A0A6J1QS68_9HYME|nr:serine/threonine-protein phosphatase 4 regulatory subunit 4-like isoform X1 [Temnothorax curvispinosus]XP_024884758.1 serine/threonine-protein phosphatase 4 regulatory subunit 4-like isoform X1 [Temnothorax curvispinosus]
MLQEGDEAPYEIASDPKGDEIQKLSVIQSLPSLLATDTQSCMSRVVPKMQQSLATASTEFHIAASSTFKTILEQKLVSHNVFSQTFLQSILNSLESRDPVICHAWLETLLDVIELLPVEVIRAQILPLTISKGQLSQPIYSRITCSRLLGKICTRFDSAMIQKEVLPTVHSLCQDVSSEVRASICLQLRFVAEGLGAESVKPALLPSLVELASDEESSVRYASVQTIVYLLPHLQEDTIKNIIAPLIKKLCENAAKSEDNVICIIAQELGKLVLGLEKCLSMFEKAWFINYFQQLAQMGIPSLKKEKPHFTFISSNPTQDERYVECRRHCAFNLPAMFIFVSGSSEDVDAILTTFDALTSDHYYMVRKTVACGIHEVSKVLGPKSARIKGNLIKLLKDDSEEVLQGLIPHIGLTLECLAESQALGTDRMDSSLMEIGKALLKCEAEVAGTHNWRLASLMHAQLEILPKCFPSDFIYSYFIPMAFSRILHARPIPVRLAAGTLFLLLLRYNMKPIQRAELRSRIFTDLANNPDCYVRMMFVRMMVEALEIFSSVYFKEHFFIVLLNLAEDPIANIRMKVVSLLPQLKNQLWMPTDKKLLTSLESVVRHLINNEKDRDVLFILKSVTQKLDEMDVKYEGQSLTTKLTRQDVEDAKKLEEEKKLSGIGAGKPGSGTIVKKGWTRTGTDSSTRGLSQSKGEHLMKNKEALHETKSLLIKYGTTSSRQAIESLKTRIQLTHPWEKVGHVNSHTNTSHFDFVNGSSNDYITPKPQCSCSKLAVFQALLTLPDACEQEYESDSQYRSYYDTDNDHAKFRKQSVQANEYSPSAFTKSFFLSLVKENKQEPQQHSVPTRDYPHEFSTNISGKDRAPNFAALRALTNAAHYNSCWAFSSMPEMSVMQSDDEFLVDAGIRIPTQFSVSQSTSKIPHLQDFIATRRQLNTTIRPRRSSVNFDKGKFKRHSSVEYEDCMKRGTSESDSLRSTSISIDYEEGLRQRNMVKENLSDQHLSKTDARTKRYSAPHGRTRFGWDSSQDRSLDEKLKRNSLILDKDKLKFTNSKCALDRTKRHSTNFSLKLPDTKETKQIVKRHSLEDHTTVRRAVKGYFSTLDVNHNQGLSKIPLRNVESRSRTAPATRASSPVHVESRLRFDIENCDDSRSSANDRHLNRFSSSDEEIDKLCRMLLYSQTAHSSTGITSRSRERYPVHLLMKKL